MRPLPLNGFFLKFVSFRNSQFGATCASVLLQLVFGCGERFFCQVVQSLVACDRLLDDAIFERMKANHRQPPCRAEQFRQSPHRHGQPFQFLIDFNAQRLKRPRRGIDGVIFRSRHATPHQSCQVRRLLNDFLLSPLANFACDPATQSLFSKLIDDVGQVLLTYPIDQLPCRFAFERIETQIQRPVALETKATIAVGQLIAGKSKVQQNSVDRFNLQRVHILRQIGVVGVNVGDAGIGNFRRHVVDGGRITIHRDHASVFAQATEDLSRMASAAQRPINNDRIGSDGESFEDLVHQDGNVDGQRITKVAKVCRKNEAKTEKIPTAGERVEVLAGAILTKYPTFHSQRMILNKADGSRQLNWWPMNGSEKTDQIGRVGPSNGLENAEAPFTEMRRADFSLPETAAHPSSVATSPLDSPCAVDHGETPGQTCDRDRLTDWRPGRWVRVKPIEQILPTLDDHGDTDSLPFMPEMAAHCGQSFRIRRIANKVCVNIRQIQIRGLDQAVILDMDRCSGRFHGGCQMACDLIWKLEWLQRIDGPPQKTRLPPPHLFRPPVAAATTEDGGKLVGLTKRRVPLEEDQRLRQGSIENCFRCQATQLSSSTYTVSPMKISQYVRDHRTNGTRVVHIARFLFAMIVRKLLRRNETLAGSHRKTPATDLQLRPGDRVRVRSLDEIVDTLDQRGCNRGLWFDRAEMEPWCGKEVTVSRRIERLIDEQTGELLHTRVPSIVLEESQCSGLHRRFCARGMLHFWREAWLERVAD